MTLTFSRVALAGPLVTTAEAKDHLYVRDTAHDAQVAEKLAAAEDAILAYLGTGGDPTWTPGTAPPQVKSAILMLTAYQYQNRGDDIGLGNRDEAKLWKAIQNDLCMYRDPTLG